MLSWLGHPLSVAAMAVLAANDHLLKQAVPGLITGKLSDVAGMVLAPPLLAVALWLLGMPAALTRAGHAAERVASWVAGAAIVITGIGFTLVKTTTVGARVASAGWTVVAGPSRVLTDPTDLMALPVLWVAWLLWCRVRGRPLGARTVRLVRVLVVLPAAVLAVAATSIVQPPNATTVERQGSHLVADLGTNGVLVSDDGGATWREGGRLTGATGRRSDCLPNDSTHCYRIVSRRLRVEETTDAGRTWRTSWEVTTSREQFLRRGLARRIEGDFDLGLVSLAVVRQGGRHAVVVANQHDGLVRRDLDGAWHRIGFPAPVDSTGGPDAVPALPTYDPGANIEFEFVLSAMLGWLVLAVGGGIARRSRTWPGLLVALHSVTGLGFLVAILAFALAFEWPFDWAAGGIGGVLVAGGMVSAAVASRHTRASPPLPRWYWPSLGGLGVMTLVLVGLPFLGWTAGTPESYWDAALMAVGSGAGGLIAALALGSWGRRRWGDPDDPFQTDPPPPR